MKRLFLLLPALLMVLPAYAQSSLFADPKAHTTGDIVTIVLAERTAAQRESGGQKESSATMGGSASAVNATGGSGQFGLDASFANGSRHRNQSVQSDLLQGTMTATVVGIDSLSGNLRIAGERRLQVNGETHLMKVSGLVRPLDVRSDNSIYSWQIAGADIQYDRKGGFGGKFLKPGTFAKVGMLAVLAGAIFGLVGN